MATNFFSNTPLSNEGFPSTYDMPFSWQLKKFGHPRNFRSPLSPLLWPQKRGVSYVFGWHVPFLAIKKTLISIGQCWSMDGEQIFFRHHLTHPHHWMMTKIFNCWKGCELMLSFWKKIKIQPLLSLFGNRTLLIAIQWCGCGKWQLKFSSCHPMVGLC